MNFSFERGQRLIIELTDRNVFEGNYESGTNNRIDVINIIESETRNVIKGKLSFYKNEITSVNILQDDTDKNSVESADKSNGKTELQSNVINLPRAEYERLQDMTQNYVYLATMDQRFLEAISYLSNCETIGIVGLGADFKPTKSIDLLVLSSWDQVYIFDLLLYRQKNFPPDLKSLLESRFIKKVGHDLLKLMECLWFCHKIRIENIFDTKLADFKLEKDKTGSGIEMRSLSQCLTVYFNFPNTLLDDEKKSINSKKWGERPLSVTRKIKAALLVTYLTVLKNKLEKLMLKDFYDAIEECSNTIYSSNSYHACVKFNSNGIIDGVKKMFS